MKKIYILLCSFLFISGFSQKTAKQLEVQKIFNTKKFYNNDIYLKDLVGAVKHSVVDYTKAEAECLGYYIGRMKASGKLEELRKYNYEEIYWMSEAECQIRDTIAEEAAVPEKQLTLEKSHSENYEYLQIKFSKTKTGYNFSNVSPPVADKIKQDFDKDKPGNYTAFYDVFYEDNQPKIITLKTRLNR